MRLTQGSSFLATLGWWTQSRWDWPQTNMKDDPIITEVRAARHRISEKYGHDLDRLGRHYQALERKLAKTGKRRFVTGFFTTSPELAGAGK